MREYRVLLVPSQEEVGVDAEPSHSVGELKTAVAELTGLPAAALQLSFNGLALEVRLPAWWWQSQDKGGRG